MEAQGQARYRRAGWAYLLLGSAILALTVLSPELASTERRSDLIHLLVGLPFFALFAWLIARGDRLVAAVLRRAGVSAEKALASGCWLQEKLVMLLTLSALVRTLVFAANGFGQRPRLTWRPFAFAVEVTSGEPRMFVNALLMAILLAFLAHASWLPFLRRRRRRRRRR